MKTVITLYSTVQKLYSTVWYQHNTIYVNIYYTNIKSCRHVQAILCYNENVRREKKKTHEGKIYLNVTFPKIQKW